MEKIGAYTDRVTPEDGWREGDPAANVRATPLLAEYFNMLQRELINVLADADLVPAIGEEDQLAQAINVIAARRAVGMVEGIPVIAVEEE
ncbi:hypothetical protein [Desulfonatronovibrio hydrogenovorans]|uniref:hypothetical protein n=1 Tax=Desulfonatronovibrio hydrogenovorans TaxID=53245 RepID=UPI0004907EE7|nr:hypothetical protein [Desulfonatronovibrio hydrogenovorans]